MTGIDNNLLQKQASEVSKELWNANVSPITQVEDNDDTIIDEEEISP